jgi:hypothetical protein
MRPKVGQLTSPHFAIPDGAFLPLSADELKDWGILSRLSPRERVRDVFGFDSHFVAAGFRLWPEAS